MKVKELTDLMYPGDAFSVENDDGSPYQVVLFNSEDSNPKDFKSVSNLKVRGLKLRVGRIGVGSQLAIYVKKKKKI